MIKIIALERMINRGNAKIFVNYRFFFRRVCRKPCTFLFEAGGLTKNGEKNTLQQFLIPEVFWRCQTGVSRLVAPISVLA